MNGWPWYLIQTVLMGIGLNAVGHSVYRAVLRLHTRWTAWQHAGDAQAAQHTERIE